MSVPLIVLWRTAPTPQYFPPKARPTHCYAEVVGNSSLLGKSRFAPLQRELLLGVNTTTASPSNRGGGRDTRRRRARSTQCGMGKRAVMRNHFSKSKCKPCFGKCTPRKCPMQRSIIRRSFSPASQIFTKFRSRKARGDCAPSLSGCALLRAVISLWLPKVPVSECVLSPVSKAFCRGIGTCLILEKNVHTVVI